MCLVSQARPGLTHLLNSIAVTTQLAHAAETLLPPRRTREREEEREREREKERERGGARTQLQLPTTSELPVSWRRWETLLGFGNKKGNIISHSCSLDATISD